MYICPTCNKEYASEEKLVKHFLNCWKEHNPNHKSTPAPRSENITKREIDNETLEFFASLGV